MGRRVMPQPRTGTVPSFSARPLVLACIRVYLLEAARNRGKVAEYVTRSRHIHRGYGFQTLLMHSPDAGPSLSLAVGEREDAADALLADYAPPDD